MKSRKVDVLTVAVGTLLSHSLLLMLSHHRDFALQRETK